jgi:fatty acid desaturase
MIDPETIVQKREWFTCSIDRKEFKKYLKRDNYHGLMRVGLWLALLVGLGVAAYQLLGTYWAIPVFFAYGVVYSACNNIWHECSHGTYFKAQWLNQFFYFFCGAMELRDMVEFRWSHARHHTYTLQKGVDPEIPTDRPPNLIFFFLDMFYLYNGTVALRDLALHSLGIPSKKAKTYVPEDEYRSMYWAARGVLALHIAVVALSIYLGSILPLLYFGLPRFYGAVVQWAFIVQQHAGLPEGHWDHRYSCRSWRVTPVMSFLLQNMENHTEHHIYPIVPFHALPRLSRRLSTEMPRRYTMLFGRGFWQMIGTLVKQRKDPSLSIMHELPPDDPSDPSAGAGGTSSEEGTT